MIAYGTEIVLTNTHKVHCKFYYSWKLYHLFYSVILLDQIWFDCVVGIIRQNERGRERKIDTMTFCVFFFWSTCNLDACISICQYALQGVVNNFTFECCLIFLFAITYEEIKSMRFAKQSQFIHKIVFFLLNILGSWLCLPFPTWPSYCHRVFRTQFPCSVQCQYYHHYPCLIEWNDCLQAPLIVSGLTDHTR